jgi:uncharacterized protein YggE
MNWILAFIISSAAMASTKQGLLVQGNCQLKVVPDRGSISFTAENQSKDLQSAVKKTTHQINELKEKIQKLKLENFELRTLNYSVYPVREYEKDKYVDKGIKVSMTLEVTTSQIQRLGDAMMEASNVGIQNVGSLMTFLSLEKSQDEYLKCLDLASIDAKKKADQLAKKLNFGVGKVINLVEAPALNQAPMPERMVMAKTAMTMDGSAPSVEAGTQNFSTQIQVTFEIK